MSQLAIPNGIWLWCWAGKRVSGATLGVNTIPNGFSQQQPELPSALPWGAFHGFGEGEIVLLACQHWGSARNVSWASCWSAWGAPSGIIIMHNWVCSSPVRRWGTCAILEQCSPQSGMGVLRGVRAHSEAGHMRHFWGVLSPHQSD